MQQLLENADLTKLSHFAGWYRLQESFLTGNYQNVLFRRV